MGYQWYVERYRRVGGIGNAQIVNKGAIWNPYNFTAFASSALFDATDSSLSNSYVGLWISNGTGPGTIEIGGLSGIPSYFDGLTNA